ncbi:zinc-finger of the MIZ type in Nse subunit-domain-containing protein [Triangularia verruculosa]|uniref:Zinc-finger of the MIZ type in Nse subunit-domain-containing protein n=1 Tax=Triangularia verruculosa TaxID=2587418 RepID=A0AAN7AVP3_9PEZI|nr:zinc-finger of the MIZ type in Nse subunit-domain-containing protein [Triangularia verruculosa]
MPRLLQRSRPSESLPARSAGSDGNALPEYEAPSFPMNDDNKAKLERMVASHRHESDARQYEKHLSESSKNLIKAVGSINDVLFQRRNQLARLVERRRTEGMEEKSHTEKELEEHVAELEATVGELTDRSEKALRRVIDCRAELEDMQSVLESVLGTVRAQQPRPEPKPKKEKRQQRNAVNDDDDDEDEDDADDDEEMEENEDVSQIVGIVDALKEARKAKIAEYSRLSAYDRYAVNNDYIPFKRTWHDAMHPDNEIPLPDPSTWFDEHGNPVKGAGGAEEDDELVVEREIVDLKCPLSLQTFKAPYSNHKCKHTFEKDAIMDFIRTSGGKAQCPVPGCSKELTITDLYPDDVMLRKMKRLAEASRRNVDATSDASASEEDDDTDASMIVGRTNNIKRERNNRHVEDIDED